VNGLVFSSGLNERAPPPPLPVPPQSASPQAPQAGFGSSSGSSSSIIVGATMKGDLGHPQHGTLGRYHPLLAPDNQQHQHQHQQQQQHHHQLDTSSISSISSSSGGGGPNHNTSGHLLHSGSGSGPSTTSSPIVGISSNGALVPPPYRDPPPPRNSPLSHRLALLDSMNGNSGPLGTGGSGGGGGGGYGNGNSNTLTSLSSTGSAGSAGGMSRKLEKDGAGTTVAGGGGGGGSSASSTISSLGPHHMPSMAALGEPMAGGANGEPGAMSAAGSSASSGLGGIGSSETLPHVTGYRELMQLIKLQREKINTQQSDISKYDTEIQYLESRGRDREVDQLDTITQEISKTDALYRQTGEQLLAYQYVEEESELVRQQEKTLKSELTLLRSKLANSETELLQCKNRIRLLMDEILVEQRKYSRQYDPNRQQLLERQLMCEVDRLQVEIDLAVQSSDQANKAHEKLKGEVAQLEGAIADKKKQVEKLVHEMKEVNLQSLAIVPPADEVRHLLEVGSVKPGSTRRMIGSPRQLENAVPTSKNPHGVWV
uniref:Ras-associating domain-containing protein n=1 Tax=Anopheles albimanus TaxID=7167 RepID=A0A182F929_ANOAL